MAGERGGRRWRRGLILTAGLAAGLTLAGLTLAANPNERDVKPAPNVQDPDEIYEKDGVTPKADSKIGAPISASRTRASSRWTCPDAARCAGISGTRLSTTPRKPTPSSPTSSW